MNKYPFILSQLNINIPFYKDKVKLEDFINVELTNNIIFVRVDTGSDAFYYQNPPLFIPKHAYCAGCDQFYVHLKTCRYQLSESLLLYTVKGYKLAGLDEKTMILKRTIDGEELQNVTTTGYNKKELEQGKGVVGRPFVEKIKAGTGNFPNQVNIKYKIQPNDESEIVQDSGRIIDIKIDVNNLRINNIPNDKKTLMFILKSLKTSLKDICWNYLDINESDSNLINLIYTHPIKIIQPYTFLSLQDCIEFPLDFTHVSTHFIPKNKANANNAKRMYIRLLNNDNMMYTIQIYNKTSNSIGGKIQVFISKSSDRNIKRKERKEKSKIRLFDFEEFHISNEILKELDHLYYFFLTYNDKHISVIKQQQQQPILAPRISKKLHSNLISGYLPTGGKNEPYMCASSLRPVPYSYYGKCNDITTDIRPFSDKGPCCTIQNPMYKDPKKRSKILIKKGGITRILKGDIRQDGYAYLNGIKRPIYDVDRQYIILKDTNEKIPRSLFDVEIVSPIDLNAYSHTILSIFVFLLHPFISIRSNTKIMWLKEIIQYYTINELKEKFNNILINDISLLKTDQRNYIKQEGSSYSIIVLLINNMYILDYYGNCLKYNNKSKNKTRTITYMLYDPMSIVLKKYTSTPILKNKPITFYNYNTKGLIVSNIIRIPLKVYSENSLGNRTKELLILPSNHLLKQHEWVLCEKNKIENKWFIIERHINKPYLLTDTYIESFFL